MEALRQLKHRTEFPAMMRGLFGEKNRCIEIGVAEGALIQEWLKPPVCFEKFYLVDPWATTTYFRSMRQEDLDRIYLRVKNLEKTAPGVEVLRMTSKVAAEEIRDNLTFVYIDALHEYENVRDDIALWWPKLVPGGILAGHDIDMAGVLRAVEEYCKEWGIEFMKVENKWDPSWYARKPL